MVRFKIKLLANVIWVILLLMIIVSSMITPNFFSYKNIVNIFYHSAVLGFLVLAESLCLLTGNFDLSIESTMAFAPAIGVLMMTSWFSGMSPIVTILIILVIGGIVGALNGFFIAKLKINPFLQTLAFQIILRGLTYKLIPLSIFDLPDQFLFLGGERVFLNIPLAVILLLGFFVLMHIFLNRTTYGRFVVSIGGNKRASFISGINVTKVMIIVYMLSGALAAFAGVLSVGRQSSITNTMGEGLVFMAFAGAVMGGVSLEGGEGTVIGMLGGLLVLGVIDNSLTMLGVDAFMIYAVKGMLIFFAIVLDTFKGRLKEKIIIKDAYKELKKSEAK